MIDDALVLRIERMRDDAEELRAEVRRRYSATSRAVSAQDIREAASSLAERWLVEVAAREDVATSLGGTELADRNVHFQRLLTCAEKLTSRKQYEQVLGAVLKDFRGRVIVPLKAQRSVSSVSSLSGPAREASQRPSENRVVFVGQSFSENDLVLNDTVARALSALGFAVVTGEKPRADQVSKKVKDRIDQCEIFLGIFSKRDKLEGKAEWATSPWIVDEKAYALARQKKLVLVREAGVVSIGGLQGDYEYLEFQRAELAELVIQLIEVFRNL